MRRLWMVLLLSMPMSTLADVVIMQNGDRLTGTVDSISGGRLLLTTQYAGGIPIDIAAIATLETEGSFQVNTGSNKVVGRFAVEDGEQILVGDNGSLSVELASVQRAGNSNLRLASLGSEWSSRADVSLIISNGNSDTESLNTLIESVLKRDTVEHAVSLLVSKEEAEDVSTKDQFDLDYGYKRFLSDKWYASGNAEYFTDELKGIDERITLGAGVGYQFWDDSFGAFSTDLGISAVREDLAGQTESNPALRWGLAYNRFFLSKQLEFFHKQSVLFIPDSDRGEVLSSSTGLRYALNDRIDSTARVDLNHETKPTPGNGKTDVTYTLGIGVKF